MSLAGQASLLPLAVVVPLAGAVIVLVVGHWSSRAAGALATVSLLAVGGLLAYVAPTVYGGHLLVHQLGGWAPLHGTVLAIAWAADPFGITYALAAAFVGAVITLVGTDELAGFASRETGQLWALFLLLEAGLIGSALTGDVFNLFVWFEVASVASYGLTAFYLGRPSALEAAFKIVVLTTIAGFVIFTGIGLLYGRFGALNFGQLHHAMAARPDLGAAGLAGIALLVVGFGTKVGLVPFHPWLPDAHSAAPGPVSALFSGLMVAMGVVALGRISALVVPDGTTRLRGVLVVLGVGSAVVGAAMSFGQDNLKRLLAYDTITQMGLVVAAIGVASPKGYAGATWHLLNHAVFKSLLFLVAGTIAHLIGTEQLSKMGGLGRRYPALAALFIVGVVAIVGIPPFNGYASRVLIHGAFSEAHQWVALGWIVLAEVLSFAALSRAAWSAFFARPRHERPVEPGRLSPVTVFGLTVLGAACLAFGLAPTRWLEGMASPAAGVLARPERYAAAITAHHTVQVHFGGIPIPGSFVEFEVLLSTSLAVVIGGLLAVWRLRRGHDPEPITTLRLLHTGSVNDYATYLAIGLVVTLAVMIR